MSEDRINWGRLAVYLGLLAFCILSWIGLVVVARWIVCG